MAEVDVVEHIPAGRSQPEQWWFRLLLLTVFIAVPPYTQRAYDPSGIPDVVAATLQQPFITAVPAILPVAKVMVLAMVLVPLALPERWSGRVLLGSYTAVLVVIAVAQNLAVTARYGLSWLVGNTAVQLVVAAGCAADAVHGRTAIAKESFRPERSWLLAPMVLALAMPYGIDAAGRVVPSMQGVLINEAALTYCMVTPLVIGVMLLFPSRVRPSTAGLVSFTGLLFAAANLAIWFVLRPVDWWMGVLHLPLALTSFLGLRLTRSGRQAAKPSPAEP